MKVEANSISYSYANNEDGVSAKNINLSIEEGEVVVICGEAGCGKTTLIRLINGIIPNYFEGNLKGSMKVCGKNISELPLYKTAQIVGSVFQNPRSQFFNLDTTSELAFGCENQGLKEEEILRRIRKESKIFNIEHLLNKNLFKLSGGEKQKIACASVFITNPDIIVLDEPSSNLDYKSIDDLKEVIKIWKNKGKTVIIADHRLYYLKDVADRFIYMKSGSIIREYSTKELTSFSYDEIRRIGLRAITLKQLNSKVDNKEPLDNKIIQLHDFKFNYDRKEVINIESLNIPQGSIIGVIGKNGAGKTTLGKCLCGILNGFKGEIILDGEKVKKKKLINKTYMVMQDVNHQLFTESVYDEVSLGMEEKNDIYIDKILKSLNLIEYKDKHPMSLSGGEKQRVAIATAQTTNKKIIVFDEPTSGLDLYHMEEVAENIKLLKEKGVTVLIITHDLELLLNCCEYILHLKDGKIKNQYPLISKNVQKLLHFFCHM